MTKHLLKIKRTFIGFQIIFLIIVFVISLILIANNYIKSVYENIKEDLNRTTQEVIDYVRENQEVPKKNAVSHVFFILDEKNGSYILERNDKYRADNVLWEQYRLKLTYQMQKQKRGWIFYPTKTSWQYLISNKIMRYSVIEEMGWIVVMEGLLPSERSLLQNVINRNVLKDLFILLIIISVVSKFLTDYYFRKMEDQILDSSSGSVLDFNQALVKKVPQKSKQKETKKRKSVKIDLNSVIPPKKSEPVKISPENTIRAQPQQMPNTNVNIKPKVTLDQSQSIETELSQAKNIFTPEPKEKPNFPISDKSSEKLTVRVKGIKSPVLKKMLEELRMQKEKI